MYLKEFNSHSIPVRDSPDILSFSHSHYNNAILTNRAVLELESTTPYYALPLTPLYGPIFSGSDGRNMEGLVTNWSERDVVALYNFRSKILIELVSKNNFNHTTP